MTDSGKLAARVVGVLLLLGMVVGMYNNLALLGPMTFSPDFMAKIATNSGKVLLSVILSLILGVFTIATSIILYPHFEVHARRLAIGFVVSTVIKFGANIVDKTMVFGLVAAGDKYAGAEPANIALYGAIGNVLATTREYAHLLDILVGFASMFIFFLLLLKCRSVPRVLSFAGLIASLLGSTEMILNIFGIDHPWHMAMLLPMAPVHLILGLWLIVKGLRERADL